MTNMSIKWEIEKKQNSNTFQRIGWEVVVFHTITFTMIGSLPPLPKSAYTFIGGFTRAAHSASFPPPLLSSPPLPSWPHLPLVKNMVLSLPATSYSETANWFPTFLFFLPFSYISYTVRERTAKSVIWEQHAHGKAGARLDNSPVSGQKHCLCVCKSPVCF